MGLRYSCPGCGRGTDDHHCSLRACDWWVCRRCRTVFSVVTQRHFNLKDMGK